jgi:hypothetical protein
MLYPKMECCPDCQARIGENHVLGCDIEQCPYCGRQLISCQCRREPPLDDRLPWTGLFPGVAECRELGWYTRRVPGKGWERCAADAPGAHENLNRLHMEATWDRDKKRFVLRKKSPSRKPPAKGRKKPT